MNENKSLKDYASIPSAVEFANEISNLRIAVLYLHRMGIIAETDSYLKKIQDLAEKSHCFVTETFCTSSDFEKRFYRAQMRAIERLEKRLSSMKAKKKKKK